MESKLTLIWTGSRWHIRASGTWNSALCGESEPNCKKKVVYSLPQRLLLCERCRQIHNIVIGSQSHG